MFRLIIAILGFFIPGGLLLAVSIFVLHKEFLAPWMPLLSASLPYLILGLGFFIGLRFHRSRLAFAILLLVLTDRILFYFGPDGTLNSVHGTIVLHSAALLLPINMVLLYISKERGILNLSGLLRFCFIIAQPIGVYYVIRKYIHVFSYLDLQLIQTSLLNTIHIPQLVMLNYSIFLILFLCLALFLRKATPRGFFWALLSCAFAFQGMYEGGGANLYFSIGGCIIFLSVIEMVYAMAYHDELTGLPGRRALNTTMQNLGRKYTIAMLDIDFFKKFNDRYGHDVGDQVLCMVASHIARVRGGGKPFRYGGEEFTIVFPGKSKKQVQKSLERVRQSIAEAQFKIRARLRPKNAPKKMRKSKNPKTVSVTISIGAAEPNRKVGKPDEVLKLADKALYRAKKKGRNCVVL